MPKKTGGLSEECFALKEVTWKIPNFWDLPATVDFYVRSRSFRFANATWYLKLFTNGAHCENSAGHIDIILVRSQSSVDEHFVRYKIGLKTRREKEFEVYSSEYTCSNDGNECGVVRYLERSEIVTRSQSLVPNGTITVFCRIRVPEQAALEASSRPQQNRNETSWTRLQEASSQTEVPESVTQTKAEEESKSVQKLHLDYSKLLKSEEDSDVCLKVSDKEFRAHRCILRARSTVFSAMFEHDTEEKASGEVVIDDLDPESFSDFLQHVYVGRVDSLSDENVFDLYLAADKYDLQELKWECREYMKRNLSVDTFCDVMSVVLRHKEEELLKMAIDYFSANFAEIVVTVNWQRLLINHPTEANELLIKALVPRKKNE